MRSTAAVPSRRGRSDRRDCLASRHAFQRSVGVGSFGQFAESTGRRVRQADQEREQHVVGDERRAAVADERQRDAGERHHLDDAADDDESLDADDRGEADGEQLLEGPVGAQGDAQAGTDDQDERHQHGGRADEAPLLADGGEDEVVLRLGDLTGVAASEAGAGQPAVGETVERLDDLVALVERVGPRVEPDVDPGLDVAELRPGEVGGDREQHRADQQVAEAFGGHPHHHDEQREEQQRRAEVALEHHDDHGEAPCQDDRGDVARFGQVQRPDLPRRCRDQLAPVGEVRRRRRWRARSWRTRRAGS